MAGPAKMGHVGTNNSTVFKFFCIIKILSFDGTVIILLNQIFSNLFPFEIQPEGSLHDSLWIHPCI